jgi:hypothetical protein
LAGEGEVAAAKEEEEGTGLKRRSRKGRFGGWWRWWI